MSETSVHVDQSAPGDLALDGAGQGDSSSLSLPGGGGGDVVGVVEQLSNDNDDIDADVIIEEVAQGAGMQAGDDGGATPQGEERRRSQELDDDDSKAAVSKNVSSELADHKVNSLILYSVFIIMRVGSCWVVLKASEASSSGPNKKGLLPR